MKQKTPLARAGRCALYLFMLVYALIILAPMLWMYVGGLKTDNELFTSPWSLPASPSLGNYTGVWQGYISTNLFNSVFFTVAGTLLVLLAAGFAAYAVSRFKFKGRYVAFLFILSGMMLAPQVSLIPLYRMLGAMGLYDSRLGLVISYVAFRIPFSFFLLWTYFVTLPLEVEESALLDGCTVMGVFFKMVVPMSKPAIITTAIMCARYIWNDFMFALVFTESDRLKTIPIGLFALRSSSRTQWSELLAGLALSALPVIILFVIFQKYFISGINDGAVKG